jgi:hypothetical protein
MDRTYRRIQFAREEGRRKELCQRRDGQTTTDVEEVASAGKEPSLQAG